MKVPLCVPNINDDDINLVTEILRSGWLAHGEYNHRFEEIFSKYLGVPHSISMNSCTSALEVALKVNGIKGEVVIPSFTWVATANAVVTSGAKPVFCEVDPETRNVNAKLIEEKISPNTEAVIVVHYGGQPCPMDEINALCQRKGLLLIEDSAETIGATWQGKQAGSFGLGCFSFFPTKNITTGEGGMFTCNDDQTANKARALIAHGISKTTFSREKDEQPWLREASIAGHNYRMSNPLAALGYNQFRRLDKMNESRKRLAAVYNNNLSDLCTTPKLIVGATHVYQMYTVLVDQKIRNQLLHILRDNDIGASVHFDPPVHKQPFYAAMFPGLEMPITEGLTQGLITLPIFPTMSDNQQMKVIELFNKAITKLSKK